MSKETTPTPVTDGLQDAIDFLKANRYRKGFETAATMLDGLLSARERLRTAANETIEFAVGCFDAAEIEGFLDRLEELEDRSDRSVYGIFHRRIAYAADRLRAALPTPPMKEGE